MCAIQIGYLSDSESTTEQRAARNWLVGQNKFAADELSFGALAQEQLGRYDVLWWHRATPIQSDPGPDTTDHLRSFVEEGGGLLLTGYALTAVDDLGIEQVPPDRRTTTAVDEPSGFLAKTIYQEHPVFDGIQGLRFHTAGPAALSPGVTYTNKIPRRGELLAATYSGTRDEQNDFCLVMWGHGEGTVFGVGAHLVFSEPQTETTSANRNRLLENIYTFLDDAGPLEEPLGTPESETGFRRLRTAVEDDPHRPKYHLTPPANWMNDPNGLVQMDGTYHLFYQHNPAGPVHGTIHWGHATSEDLVHWRDRPIAMEPSVDGPDRYGCYSGTAVTTDDGAAALYTGITDTKQTTCLATADGPDIETWEKYDGNPVVADPPMDFEPRSTERLAQKWDFRDPSIWASDDGWYHLVGTGTQNGSGAALLYQTTDLRDWEYVGPLTVDTAVDTGPMWECPELFSLGDVDLFHISDYSHRSSDRAGVSYFLGQFDVEGPRFDVERSGVLDAGRFYAPQSLEDDDGRRILVGWLPESRIPQDRWDAGWAGAMSLPRVVSETDGELRQSPVPAVQQLREDHPVSTRITLEDERQPLDARGTALEIYVRFDPGTSEEAGLVVRHTPDDAERTVVRYEPDAERVILDRSESSLLEAESDEALEEMPVETAADDLLEVRLFLDRSIVETFVDGRTAVTGRVYPTRRDSDHVSAYATGSADLEVDIWQLGPIFDL